MNKHYFADFINIIETLRAPGGCPWDQEQTAESLRSGILEEAYECVDAINSHDDNHIKEELGDLLLLAGMVSYIKEQEGSFTVEDVVRGVSEKLVRRHPHVFADGKVKDADAVIKQWDQIKEDVEGRKDPESRLNTVPKSLPPLERAYKYQKKAAKVGFDWTNREHVWDKVEEEVVELKELGPSPKRADVEAELGDLLFAVVNLSRHYGVDPAIALNRTNKKFRNRFGYIERSMRNEGKELSAAEFAAMDALWDKAKSLEK